MLCPICNFPLYDDTPHSVYLEGGIIRETHTHCIAPATWKHVADDDPDLIEDEGPYIIEEGDEWECPYCEQLMTAQDDVSSSPDGTAHTACVEARIAAGDPHF